METLGQCYDFIFLGQDTGKMDTLWRRFKEDVDLFCIGTLVSFYCGGCHNLDDVHRMFINSAKRTEIVDSIWKVTTGDLVSCSYIVLPNRMALHLHMFLGESAERIQPALRGTDFCNWKRAGDYRYQQLAKKRIIRCATKKFKDANRSIRKRGEPRDRNKRGRDETSDTPEGDKKPAGKKTPPARKPKVPKPDASDETEESAEPTLFCSLKDWSLADKSNIPKSYLEVQTPHPVVGKSNGAACMQMRDGKNARTSIYPEGRKAVTFYEYANQQFACNKNLHERLHGARNREEYMDHLEKALNADVAVTTMPVNEDEPYQTDELFVLSGNVVSSEFEEMFPGLSLVDIAARSMEDLLSRATVDKNRAIPKLQIGWKTQDFENTADFEHCTSQLFSKPKLHSSAKDIPDEQLRYDLSQVALFNQRMMLKCLQQPNLLNNEIRRREFADKFSRDFYGDIGIEFEGGQINVTVLGRDEVDVFTSLASDIVIERDIGTLYLPVGKGVWDHVDKNNCDKPGYEWLVSSSMILYHRIYKAYFRWWFGCYFRKICGNYMERGSNVSLVVTDIQNYLATSDVTSIVDIAWQKMTTGGTGDICLTSDGLSLWSFGATPSRTTYLSLFASSINDMTVMLKLTRKHRFYLSNLALLHNGAVGFYIIMNKWMKDGVNPFEQSDPLPIFYLKECECHPEVLSPCTSPFSSQRFPPFSGSFWHNLKSDDEDKVQYALDQFEKRSEQMEDLCDTLNDLKDSDEGLPPPNQLCRAVGYTLSGDKRHMPYSDEFDFDESYRIPHCGKFTVYMYLPLIVMTKLLTEEFIPAASHTEFNETSTYAKRLAELGYSTKIQVDALIKHLSDLFGLETGIIENILCKIYREKKVFDIRFLGQLMYDFID